jgi:hypothetical protein
MSTPELTLAVACLIAVPGLLMFGSVALNAGPFGWVPALHFRTNRGEKGACHGQDHEAIGHGAAGLERGLLHELSAAGGQNPRRHHLPEGDDR